MNTGTLSMHPGWHPRALWAELQARERTLALFGAVMLLAMLPTLVALGLDERTVRGVNVWIKPLKFMLSIALFAWTMAWFAGLLTPTGRRSGLVRVAVWTVVATSTFEIAYIVLQSALGAASHYNFSDRLHVALYSVMGLAATVLTATQLLLAWAIVRHGRGDIHPTWRAAVITGLVMSFFLGAGAGGLLGSMQPPAGAGLPFVGWHLGGGDLRPAHFLGLHAQQLVPLVGLALTALPVARGRVVLAAFAVIYTLLWALAMARGLDGAVPTPPPGFF